MEKIKTSLAHKILKILKWAFLILLGLYIILIICRAFYLNGQDKTNAQVEKIHSTKLTLDDVMGKNLPPDPGTLADQTVQGIDVNKNGIRDDVELAVFNAYPNSAKTRAVLLQYALVLQMEATEPIVNTETATAIAEKESQSYDCIGEIVPRSDNDLKQIEEYRDFIKTKQLNTTDRKNLKETFDKYTRSFELQSGCDVDLNILQN